MNTNIKNTSYISPEYVLPIPIVALLVPITER